MSARDNLAFYIGYEKGEEDPRFEQLVDAVIAARDAEIVAWLVKKAREVRATPKSRQESAADTLARMASKIQRGAVRPSNLRMLPATPVTEPDLHAVILAAIQSFRSTARTDQTWAEQLATHIHAAVAPHTDVARILAELDRMAAETGDERAAAHLAITANIVRAVAQSLRLQDGDQS